MAGYLFRRVLAAIPVLLGVSVLAFALIRLVPGDVVTATLGLHYTEAQGAALREAHGLDRPAVVQYLLWLRNVATGELGHSLMADRPVTALIFERLPVTLELAGGSLIYALLTGIPLGVLAALRRSGPVDHACSIAGLAGISIPGFWLGTLLILLFSLKLGWLPSGDFVSLVDDPWANLEHMLLPVLALGTAVAAVIMRMTRSAVLDVLRQDYVRTARAKGVARSGVIVRHTLRNALVPVVTIAGLQAGYLLGGSVVIEEVFSLPGLGRLALEAIGNRDYPLLQGVLLFVAGGFVVLNLLVDLLYSVLDPRIRYRGAAT
jgi:peptide/nickel transport system permease protein